MNRLAADMHVHTVLSPCASREMTPPAIVREAVRRAGSRFRKPSNSSIGTADSRWPRTGCPW